MSRLRPSTKGNQQRNRISKKRFGLESLETRKLFAGDAFEVIDVDISRADADSEVPCGPNAYVAGCDVLAPTLDEEIPANTPDDKLPPHEDPLEPTPNPQEAPEPSGEVPCDPKGIVAGCDVLAPETDEEIPANTPDDKLPPHEDPLEPTPNPQEAPEPSGEVPCDPMGIVAGCDVLAPETDEEIPANTPDRQIATT